MKEARLQTGQFVAGAALIEKGGQKLLRVTMPLGMQLMPGARSLSMAMRRARRLT